MKVYTYSEVREKLSSILEESKTEEVFIKRRRGYMYAFVPKSVRPRCPPFKESQGNVKIREGCPG